MRHPKGHANGRERRQPSPTEPSRRRDAPNAFGANAVFRENTARVIAQTSSSGGTNFFSSIGSWLNLAGTVMTNQLIVNYPAQTFSFFLNGTMLASIPFSGGITNVNVVGQMGFEWDDPFGDSLQFALDDVRIETVPEPATLEMVALGVMVLLGKRRLRRDPL